MIVGEDSCLCFFSSLFTICYMHFGSSQAEEKKVPEKTLQTPLLPSPVADHVKCNILKAQLENASRVSAQVRASTPLIFCREVSSVTCTRGALGLLCQSGPART